MIVLIGGRSAGGVEKQGSGDCRNRLLGDILDYLRSTPREEGGYEADNCPICHGSCLAVP